MHSAGVVNPRATVLFPLLAALAGCSWVLADPDLDRLQGADGDGDADADADSQDDFEAEPVDDGDAADDERQGDGDGDGDGDADREGDGDGQGEGGGGGDGHGGGDGDGGGGGDEPNDPGDEVGCEEGATLCGDHCADLSSDDEHCGDCGVACGDGEVCRQGRCDCAEGLTDCGFLLRRDCRDLRSDPDNCGFCGSRCGNPGSVCIEASCGRPVDNCDWCGGLDQCCDVDDGLYCFFLGSPCS